MPDIDKAFKFDVVVATDALFSIKPGFYNIPRFLCDSCDGPKLVIMYQLQFFIQISFSFSIHVI